MTITLDFVPDPAEASTYREFGDDDEIWGYSPTITWFRFPVGFVVDEVELIPPRYYGHGFPVAVLGLALNLERAVSSARSDASSEVPLGPYKLWLRPTGSSVAVSSSVSKSAATVEIDELEVAVTEFCRKVASFVERNVPQLPRLTELQDWFASHR